eukprot:242120_1
MAEIFHNVHSQFQYAKETQTEYCYKLDYGSIQDCGSVQWIGSYTDTETFPQSPQTAPRTSSQKDHQINDCNNDQISIFDGQRPFLNQNRVQSMPMEHKHVRYSYEITYVDTMYNQINFCPFIT